MLHDADIREPLFDYLEDSYGKIRILEEVQISRSRADVIMVTDDSLVGLEIKSDADTYVRLERQVKDYNLFFDYINRRGVCLSSLFLYPHAWKQQYRNDCNIRFPVLKRLHLPRM